MTAIVAAAVRCVRLRKAASTISWKMCEKNGSLIDDLGNCYCQDLFITSPKTYANNDDDEETKILLRQHVDDESIATVARFRAFASSSSSTVTVCILYFSIFYKCFTTIVV